MKPFRLGAILTVSMSAAPAEGVRNTKANRSAGWDENGLIRRITTQPLVDESCWKACGGDEVTYRVAGHVTMQKNEPP